MFETTMWLEHKIVVLLFLKFTLVPLLYQPCMSESEKEAPGTRLKSIPNEKCPYHPFL